MRPGRYRKLIAYVVGALSEAVTLGVLHGAAARGVATTIAVLTGAGIYQATNDK